MRSRVALDRIQIECSDYSDLKGCHCEKTLDKRASENEETPRTEPSATR
jgi:hypothetical protein